MKEYIATLKRIEKELEEAYTTWQDSQGWTDLCNKNILGNATMEIAKQAGTAVAGVSILRISVESKSEAWEIN